MSEDYTLYKGESVVGKIYKVHDSHMIYNTKWKVIYPGGGFFYFGTLSGLKNQLDNMGYSV